MNHKTITIPDSFIKKYQLPSFTATREHFKHLVDIQNYSELLLSPGLTEEMLGKCHFRKMRVENTSRVFSHELSVALTLLSEVENKPEFYTTAWLVSMFSKWWRIISCRNLSLALGKKNSQVYKYNYKFFKRVH